MAWPKLVVLKGVGGDGVLATKMHQEKGRPEYRELLLAWRTID